jgi:hypothetical protein
MDEEWMKVETLFFFKCEPKHPLKSLPKAMTFALNLQTNG